MEMSLTFRNAIALNNMGVLLLNKHCYRQALETLNDSISLLKQSSLSDDVESSSATTEYSLEAAKKNHVALKRLSQPEICNLSECTAIEVVVSSDFSLEEACFATEGRFVDVFHPIRIDEIDVSYRLDFDIDFECGVVLHNFAIAHLCMWQSKMKTNLSSRQLHYNCAIKLLQLSHSIYAKAIKEVDTDALVSHPNLLRVKAVILRTLVMSLKCSASSQHQIAAQTFRSVLANVQSVVSDIARTNATLFGDQLPSAAAA